MIARVAIVTALLALATPALAQRVPGKLLSRSTAPLTGSSFGRPAARGSPRLRAARPGLPPERRALPPQLRAPRSGGLLARRGAERGPSRRQLVEAFAEVRQGSRSGQLASAASRFVQIRQQLGGSRTARRVGRQVARTARRLANERSRLGDVVGTRDALTAIDTLRQAKQLGWLQRWRAGRAERRAFGRAIHEARQAADQGDLGRAAQQVGFASELRGTGNRRVSRAAARLYDRSLKAAKQHARHGDPESTMAALEAAGMVASSLGRQARFGEVAEALMTTAVEKALPIFTERAQDLVRARRPAEAASLLAEVLAMQQGTGVVPSRSVRRQQERLLRLLAPHLQAQPAAAAAEPAVEQDGNEEAPEDEPSDPSWIRRAVRTATVDRVQ